MNVMLANTNNSNVTNANVHNSLGMPILNGNAPISMNNINTNVFPYI